MIGILFFISFFAIVIFIFWFAKWCTEFVPEGPAKRYSFWGVIAACMFILLGDEVIGGIQFGYLCYVGPGLEVLVDDLEGRKVKGTSTMMEIKLSPIKINETKIFMKDVDTDEPVFEYSLYDADGGWLTHWINFNSSSESFLYSGGCYRELGINELILKHNMTKEI